MDEQARVLLVQLAKALAVEVNNCESKGNYSHHHDHCRDLIEQAATYELGG